MGMELRSGSVVGQGILNPQLRPVFEEGCKVLFERWTALNLAVENEWGGQDSRQKAQALFAETLQWFFRKKEHYPDELAECLDDAILQDFNVEAEDGSPDQMSKSLVKWYQDCLKNDFSDLKRWRTEEAAVAAAKAKSIKVVVDRDGMQVDGDEGSSSSGAEDDSDGGDMDMGEGAPVPQPRAESAPAQRQEPVVDEDGFELVQKKGGRGKR